MATTSFRRSSSRCPPSQCPTGAPSGAASASRC
jgi:hypothetical protein